MQNNDDLWNEYEQVYDPGKQKKYKDTEVHIKESGAEDAKTFRQPNRTRRFKPAFYVWLSTAVGFLLLAFLVFFPMADAAERKMDKIPVQRMSMTVDSKYIAGEDNTLYGFFDGSDYYSTVYDDDREWWLVCDGGVRVQSANGRWQKYDEGGHIMAYTADKGQSWFDDMTMARRNEGDEAFLPGMGALMSIVAAILITMQLIFRRKDLNNPYYTSKRREKR